MSPRWRASVLPALVAATIITGAVLPAVRGQVWLVGLVVTGLPVAVRTIRGALRGKYNADLVATLAITTAVVLVQPLPGLIVVLMQTGGEALERYAERRASAAVRALEAGAPRLAHRRLTPESLEDVPVDSIRVGDRLVVLPGELVPCDGQVEAGTSHVDASRLTGEPLPTRVGPGAQLMSGSINGEGPLTLVATSLAAQSQYARIVALVREAQASKAPLQRAADRAAIWFTPLTLLLCAVTWFLSHDATRVLAVLVVATPCPLILAAPVAVIGGISRAAEHNIIFRQGTALEQLGQVTVAVFDKTGTLTLGRPAVHAVRALPPFSEADILSWSASVEQGSGHLLARSVVEAARTRGHAILPATEVVDTAGRGVTGLVDGMTVAVGSAGWVTERHPGTGAQFDLALEPGNELRAVVAVNGKAAGVIEFADEPRRELSGLIPRLRELGVLRALVLTGDRLASARTAAEAAGIDDIHADLLPGEKTAIIESLMADGSRVLMVGDGTNDAPALSRATVGVALAAHGGGISAEAASVVLLADDLSLVADAIQISQRTMRIARQSIGAGLGLSLLAMVVAAAGYIPPLEGALLQELIDVAVILNALRASLPMPASGDTGLAPSPLAAA
ncbi:MAG: heavy metal translocating P-type ATPase [Gemmatimonadota bacterium]